MVTYMHASLRRDLSTGTQCAVKLFKRPVDPEVAQQLVQGINIQCETQPRS